MTQYLTPNEERFFAETDSATIQNAIAAAEADGCREVHIPRYNARMDRNEWRISETIRIPDCFTVILDNCYMVQETGVIANLFANSRFDDVEYITKIENEQHDITVLGRGNAVCDGGVHNGLLEKTTMKNGYPYIWNNAMFLWINVRGLRVENIRVQHQRFWAMCHAYCRGVHLKNLNFYAIPHVPNLDAIDFRTGCSDFTVENVTGRSGDDMLAMTALPCGGGESSYFVEGKDRDIHGAKIRNVKADPYQYYLVRILNQDGSRIYDIDLDTLMDASDYRTKKRPSNSLGIGSPAYCRKRMAVRGETYNIHARNITSRGEAAVMFGNTVCDSDFTNIHTFGDNVNGIGLMGHCDLHNVTVEDLFYAPFQSEIFTSRALPPEKFNGTVVKLVQGCGDITVRGVRAGQAKCMLEVSGPIEVTWGRCECEFANTQVSVSGAAKLIREES